MSQDWYSAKLRYVVFIVGRGSTLIYESVFLFCASDYESAFEIALSIGKGEEEEYLNEDKKLVKWKFSEIVTLDFIGELKATGTEICADPTRFSEEQMITEDIEYHPEFSQPTQTI